MFRFLNPTEEKDFNYLSQLHHLRYNVFYKSLGWRDGLQIHSMMEFDQYDHNDAKYLVRINDHDQVDACARLIPTNHPYLLGYSFGSYIEKGKVPTDNHTIEISRLCANPRTTPSNITGQLMAAFLEYALENNITSYVSLSDRKIIPVVRKFGWQANLLGDFHDTGTEISVALSYDVTKDYYENVCKVVGVGSLLNGHPLKAETLKQ